MNAKIRTRAILVAALATGAAIIAVGGLSAAGGNPSAQSPFTPKPQTATSDPQLTAAFRVFREAPAEVSPYATPPTFAHGGANPTLSRQVGDTQKGMYAVAGQDSVCLQDEHFSNCVTAGFAASGHIIGYLSCGGVPDGKLEVFGLTPDGIDHVTAVRSNRTKQDIPVITNAFAAQVVHHVVSIEWTRDGTTDREPGNYPSEVPDCSPQTYGEHDKANEAAVREHVTLF